MTNFKKSFLAGLFSFITISILTLLTYKTVYGVFLLASFGSSMVLLYGYPESPFAQPKNVFFGHFITTTIGLIFLNFVPFPIYIIIPLAVGFGISSPEHIIKVREWGADGVIIGSAFVKRISDSKDSQIVTEVGKFCSEMRKAADKVLD